VAQWSDEECCGCCAPRWSPRWGTRRGAAVSGPPPATARPQGDPAAGPDAPGPGAGRRPEGAPGSGPEKR